ncbi:unnamed protein product, partial [Polarella glacialis]
NKSSAAMVFSGSSTLISIASDESASDGSGARLSAAKSVLWETRPCRNLGVLGLLWLEVLALIFAVTLPAYFTNSGLVISTVVLTSYAFTADRASFRVQLRAPLSFFFPSRHSLYGLHPSPLRVRGFYLLSLIRAFVLVTIIYWSATATSSSLPIGETIGSYFHALFSNEKVSAYEVLACPTEWAKDTPCGNERDGLPAWAPCHTISNRVYIDCQNKAGWRQASACDFHVSFCGLIQSPPLEVPDLGWEFHIPFVMLFAMLIPPIGLLGLPVLLCCGSSVGKDLDLKQKILSRAKQVNERLVAQAEGQEIATPDPMILTEAGFYYADLFLDLSVIYQYFVSHNTSFGVVQVLIFAASFVHSFRTGGPFQMWREAKLSYERGVPTDLFVDIMQSERQFEALPSLLLQWYAYPFLINSQWGMLKGALSLLSSLRSVVMAVHIEQHLCIDEEDEEGSFDSDSEVSKDCEED